MKQSTKDFNKELHLRLNKITHVKKTNQWWNLKCDKCKKENLKEVFVREMVAGNGLGSDMSYGLDNQLTKIKYCKKCINKYRG